MGDVSKFIPISGNGENGENNIFGGIGTENPNGTGTTWEAGNVTAEGTTNSTQNSSTSGNPTTENTWEAGNVTTTGVTSTTQNGNSNTTESPWKIGSTCTTGTSKNSNTTISSNGVNSEEPVTSGFRVCGSSNNLPAKQSFWSKLKSFFFYDAEELAELESQKAQNVVNETTQPQESTWTKIMKWFFYEE